MTLNHSAPHSTFLKIRIYRSFAEFARDLFVRNIRIRHWEQYRKV